MDQTINLIVGLNVLIFIGLTAIIRGWQKKHGKITEKRLALFLLLFLSYFFMSPLIPELLIRPDVTILVIIGFLLILWGLGYPFSRWVYRQFNQSK
jgi:Ca2+/Na+ antiporter